MNLQKVLQIVIVLSAKVCAKEYYIYRLLGTDSQKINLFECNNIYLYKLHVNHIRCKFTPNEIIMARQSISFTKPNDEWLKSQVKSEEYSSKSELVNDLIRQARKQQAEIDWIRAKLLKSENSGFTNETKEQILKQSKSLFNGKLHLK
jgi:antitoxin ParD1/3/4